MGQPHGAHQRVGNRERRAFPARPTARDARGFEGHHAPRNHRRVAESRRRRLGRRRQGGERSRVEERRRDSLDLSNAGRPRCFRPNVVSAPDDARTARLAARPMTPRALHASRQPMARNLKENQMTQSDKTRRAPRGWAWYITRAQAIAEHNLYDVTEQARAVGITCPVALTPAACGECVWVSDRDPEREAARLGPLLE